MAGQYVTIDNTRRAYMYTEDKELCDKVAHSLSTARTSIFKDAVLKDTERKLRLKEESTAPTGKLVTLDEADIVDGKVQRSPKPTTSQESPSSSQSQGPQEQ